ncbi:WD40 repeat domain-containing protein [Labrys monachus]|uniref:Anaphase-promoting complex subunit 4 WD40 domain-containing protein n=1 Tax=Labrys monachus TaxID=217067 RepID=A0ABU0FBE0_9HYPH|nr:hypothetical protein [Labrys monachus]MDQ0391932.1 hypothetical protein [Labrys monachus]
MDRTEETATLYSLLARQWSVGAGVERLCFDAAEGAVAFALADGRVALARMQDAEPPEDRYRIAADDGRATISRRSRPVPPAMQLIVDAGPVRLAPLGEAGFVAGGRGGRLARLTVAEGVEPFADVGGGPVAALAVLPGGRAVAAAGTVLAACEADGVLRLLRADDEEPSAMAASPDGSRLALGGPHGLSLRTLGGEGEARHLPLGTVFELAWSPDGAWLVASVAQGGIVLVHAGSGESLPIPDYPAPVRSLSWSADSRHLATGGAFRIVVWRVDTLFQDRTRPENPQTGRAGLVPVEAVDIHPHRPLVAAGYGDGSVVVAQIGKRDELVVRTAGGSAVRALRWSRDGRHLALGTEEGQAAIVTFPSGLFK